MILSNSSCTLKTATLSPLLAKNSYVSHNQFNHNKAGFSEGNLFLRGIGEGGGVGCQFGPTSIFLEELT